MDAFDQLTLELFGDFRNRSEENWLFSQSTRSNSISSSASSTTMEAAKAERANKKRTFTRSLNRVKKELEKGKVDKFRMQSAMESMIQAHRNLVEAGEKVFQLLPSGDSPEDKAELKEEEDYMEAEDDKFHEVQTAVAERLKPADTGAPAPQVCAYELAKRRLKVQLKIAKDATKGPIITEMEEVRDGLKRVFQRVEVAYDQKAATLRLDSKESKELEVGYQELHSEYHQQLLEIVKLVKTKEESSLPPGVRFPTVKLAEFDGQYIKFRQWWDQFESSVHNNDRIPTNAKLLMLLNHLKGEARRSVEHYPAEDSSYEPMRAAIKERFGQNAIILQEVVQAMISHTAKGFSPADCRDTLDGMIGHLQTLRAIGAQVDEGPSAGTYIAVILPKLRQEYRRVWYKYVHDRRTEDKVKIKAKASADGAGGGATTDKSEFPTLAEFLSVMNREIDADRKASTAPARTERREDKKQAATALVTQGQDRSELQKKDYPKQKKPGQNKTSSERPAKQRACGLCKVLATASNGHAGEKCPEVKRLSPKERYQRVKETNGCVKCLNELHRSEECPRQGQLCQVNGCQGVHHPLVHFSNQ